MPAPAAAACRSSAADSQTMRETNIVASASHTATDSSSATTCELSNSTIVTPTQSAVPRAVATTSTTRLAIALDHTNEVRESGLVSTRIAVPLRRSPATAAAPVMITTRSASWMRLPMNCA